jgi:hypothetical protein
MPHGLFCDFLDCQHFQHLTRDLTAGGLVTAFDANADSDFMTPEMAEAGQNLANNYRGHPGDGIVDQIC